jgi:protocatechuate 3,4-dioxygenase beta subunit
MKILGKSNKKIVSMILMAALFFSAISPIAIVVKATPEVGYLSVAVTVTGNSASVKVIGDNTTDVAGADVYIDYAYVGTTDDYGYVNESSLSPGDHHAYAEYGELSADSYFRIEGNAIFLTVTVNGTSVSINVIDNASLPVAGADAYIDGEYVGTSNAYGFVNVTVSAKPGMHGVHVQYGDLAVGAEFRIGGGAISLKTTVNGTSVSVRILNNKSEPVSDADVYIDGWYTATTNVTGYVNESGLRPGEHYVYAAYGDLYTEEVFRIGGDAVFLKTTTNKTAVSVRVIDNKSEPVHGADVYIDDWYAGTTDDNGYVNDSGLRPGEHYAYVVYGDLFADEIFRVGGDAITLKVAVNKTSVSARALDNKSEPLAGADVYIDGWYAGTTDDNGYVNDSGLSPGEHSVYAVYGDLYDEKSFEIAGDYITANIVVNGTTIKVLVLDKDKEPVKDASVYIDGWYVGDTNTYGYLNESSIGAGNHYLEVIYGTGYLYDEFEIKDETLEYILINAVTNNKVGGGYKNDINISVVYTKDKNETIVKTADIYIDGEYKGKTTNGYLYVTNFEEGQHYVYAEYNASGNFLYAETTFESQGTGEDYIKARPRLEDTDGDGHASDIENISDLNIRDDNGTLITSNITIYIDANITIYVYSNTSATVYVDGVLVLDNGTIIVDQTTKSRASYINFNTKGLSAGAHTVKATTTDGRTTEVTVTSQGSGENFISTKSFILDSDKSGAKDDVKIYVYDSKNAPIPNAVVSYKLNNVPGTATTNSDGYYVIKSLANGNYKINMTYSGMTTSTDFKIIESVAAANNPPVINAILDQTVTVGQTFTLQVTATDVDNDQLVYADNSTLFVINAATGLISFAPVSQDVGKHAIKITVSDGKNTTERTFNLTINAAAGPVAILTIDSVSVDKTSYVENEGVTVTVVLKNAGNASGSGSLLVKIGSDEIINSVFVVDANSTKTEKRTWSAKVGESQKVVATLNGTGTTESAVFRVTKPAAKTEEKKGFLPGFEMAFAIMSLLGVAALVARRRRL